MNWCSNKDWLTVMYEWLGVRSVIININGRTYVHLHKNYKALFEWNVRMVRREISYNSY